MKTLFILTSLTCSLAMAQMNHEQKIELSALAKLIQATESLAEERSCMDDSDCVSVALGHKACGGPADYTFTSKLNSNFEEVQYLAQRTREKGREFNQKYGIISTCSVTRPRTSSCEFNKCMIK